MKLTSEPTWDSAMISMRKMNKTMKDCVSIILFAALFRNRTIDNNHGNTKREQY